MSERSTTDLMKEVTGISIGWAIAMILLGCVAIVLPWATGLAVSVFVGWIIVLSGVAQLAYAFAAQDAGTFIWRILIGLVYLIGGGYLAFHPGIALESLTLVVAVMFFLEGMVDIVLFIQFRALSGSAWILFDAIVTLLLAYAIWHPWPASTAWAIGTLVGINLVVSGFTRLMYSAAARSTLKAIA